MSSPFVRRSAAITAGAVVLAGLVAAPTAAFAATGSSAPFPDGTATVEPDPDGAGDLYTLTQDVSTFTTITMPNDATLDGAGYTITAVEDATHPNFPGPVLASAVGTDLAPAELDIKNLDITTVGFGNGNSGGLLNGIYMYRAGGSLTNVSVNGISHGNGVQEGNAISIRNRVTLDNIDVPRATVTLDNIDITNYQKTGLLLDGNLKFAVTDARIGQGAGPTGLANPGIGANSLQISRGASGTVTDATIKLNSHEVATGVLLHNARNVDFDRVTVDGPATAYTGVNVANSSHTIDTNFTMRDSNVTAATSAEGSVGVYAGGTPASVTATVIDTSVTGWTKATDGNVTRVTTPTTPTTPVTPAVPVTPATPAVPVPAAQKVNVVGKHQAKRPNERGLRIGFNAAKLGANQVEGKLLNWRVKVDGRRAALIRQHAGDTDRWAQKFGKDTGTHVVKVVKNGVPVRTYKVHTG